MTKTVVNELSGIPITITYGSPKDFLEALRKHKVQDWEDIDVSGKAGYCVETSAGSGEHRLFVFISNAGWNVDSCYECIAHESFHILIYIHRIMQGYTDKLVIYTPQHETWAYHLGTIYQHILDVVITGKALDSKKAEKAKLGI